MGKEKALLELYPSDHLVVFMQRSCQDSQMMRDLLREENFTAENGRVVYVNARDGEMLTTNFNPSGKGIYPSYTKEGYRLLDDEFGDVLPKVFRVSVGGRLDPVLYYTHHGMGLKEVLLI
jgi:hypothetical protein